LVVFKPAGICVVEENGAYSLTTILQEKSNIFNFPKPCHRIDRNTFGLVLFAKNEDTLNILVEKFKNKEIEKHYIAIVCGILSKKVFSMNAYLFKDETKSMVYISDSMKNGYVPISTVYTVIKEDFRKNISLLDIQIKTR